MNYIFLPISKCNRLFLIIAILGFSLLGPAIANYLPSPPGIDPSHASRLNKFSLYLVAILIAPVVETFLFQSLPVLIASKFRVSENFLFLAIVSPFIVAHFIPVAPLPSLVNGVVGGISLGICYLIFMRDSHIRAFCITMILHSVHNTIVLCMQE